MIKRGFDVLASSIALIVLGPVMAIIGVLVKRDSAGPALFRQERVGRDGKPFTLLKFRSMTNDSSATPPLLTITTDPRITRFGSRLRSHKLDELPQLLNVVRGDMSIVGPRPEVPEYVALWHEDDRRVILSVRPGITDPATLELRREEDLLASQPDPERYYREVLLPRKTRIYRDYVVNQSLRGDVGLILRTLVAIARR